MARKKNSITPSEAAQSKVAIRTIIRAAAAHAAATRRNATNRTGTTSPDSSLIIESTRHGKAPPSYKSPPALEDPSTPPVARKNPLLSLEVLISLMTFSKSL
jgi:hypothetical protein